MAYRWLSLGLALFVAMPSPPVVGGDCGRPSYYSAPQTSYYSAPQSTYYTAPQTGYYTVPQVSQYVVPQTTQYVAASYAAPMAMAPQAGSQASAQTCAEPSSQSAILAGILPILLPRLIDRIFPDAPAAPPASGDVNSRLTKIESRLDKLEARVFAEETKKNGKNGLDRVPPPGSAKNGETKKIIQGITEIQQMQAQMANRLIALDENTKKNAEDMKKIESFLVSKFDEEYKKHEPARE